jgi:dATP/dGTP diphosphohydrolase/uncharacterized protein DUF4406
MRIYLSGPMTGYADWNYPAFNCAAKTLRGQGHDVFNPAENDNGSSGKPREFYLRIDVKAVADAEAVVVLPGWERSEGASLEVHIAKHLAMPVFTYPTMKPLDEQGAKYDNEKTRYDLINADALDALARVYTHGARKYGDRNYARGILWGRVFGAIMRHLWAFWRGEDLDPESGLPHTIHAAWGCFTLTEYMKTRRNWDDRPVFTEDATPQEKDRATRDSIQLHVVRDREEGSMGRPEREAAQV